MAGEMTVRYRWGDFELAARAATDREAFAYLAHWQDVFAVDTCGNCGKQNLQFRHRIPKGHEFFEVMCRDCRYVLKMVAAKDQSKPLFPDQEGWQPPYEGGRRQSYDQIAARVAKRAPDRPDDVDEESIPF